MTVSIRLTDQDEKLFKSYAKTKNITLSALFRNSVMEKIEDEYDLAIYREALEEYNMNPKNYTHDEVCRMLGIE